MREHQSIYLFFPYTLSSGFVRTYVGSCMAWVLFPTSSLSAYLLVFRPTNTRSASDMQTLLPLLLGLLTLAACSGSCCHPLCELRSLAEQNHPHCSLCLLPSTSLLHSRAPVFLLSYFKCLSNLGNCHLLQEALLALLRHSSYVCVYGDLLLL